jgi:hypothetical protein
MRAVVRGFAAALVFSVTMAALPSQPGKVRECLPWMNLQMCLRYLEPERMDDLSAPSWQRHRGVPLRCFGPRCKEAGR